MAQQRLWKDISHPEPRHRGGDLPGAGGGQGRCGEGRGRRQQGLQVSGYRKSQVFRKLKI